MRAYLQLAKLRLLTELTYRFDVFARIGTHLILMLATIFLWQTAYRGDGTVAGVDRDQMVKYAVMSALLGAAFVTHAQHVVSRKIRRGDIAVDFIRPVSPPAAWLADDIGMGLSGVAMQLLPLLLISLAFVPPPLPAGAGALLLFLPSCVLSYGIVWLISLMAGMLAFWTMELGHMGAVKDAILRILSGSFVPLWFFPPWAQKVSRFLPFEYTYQLPLGVYIGRTPPRAALAGIAVQALWVAALGALAAFMWRRGSRRALVQGG